jgi:hypothetical protein
MSWTGSLKLPRLLYLPVLLYAQKMLYYSNYYLSLPFISPTRTMLYTRWIFLRAAYSILFYCSPSAHAL